MNHNERKLNITEKLEQLLSSVEDIITIEENNSDNTFRFDLCKQRIIHLYNLIAEYQKALEKSSLTASEQIQPTETAAKCEPVTEESKADEPLIVENIETVEETLPVSKEPELFELSEPSEESADIPSDLMADDSNPHQQKIISDNFKNESPSLYEKFNTESKDKSIGGKIQGAPVHDLKKAIGINDRFSFINELFAGSKNNYDVFIDELCLMSSVSQIEEYVEMQSSTRSWTSKPSFERFSDLIRRYSITK
jgi:hypothetical protein